MFTRVLRRERPDLPPEFFVVQRAGWLRIGVGSAANQKILARLRGATDDSADDELLEAKEVANLDGLDCLEGPTARPAFGSSMAQAAWPPEAQHSGGRPGRRDT